jgi:hypothetical protein
MFNNEKNEEVLFSKRELLSGGLILAGLGAFPNRVLSPRQESIVLGNILGDGHLQLSPNEKTTRLRFNHSMKQAAYVAWEFNELGWLCDGVSRPKHIVEKNQYDICRAYTAYKPDLTKFHKLTYKRTNLPNRKFIKTIPPDFGKYLTNPETLMVWYLDDGTLRADGGACRLATQSFTLAEHEILQEALQKNFNIKTVIEGWSDKAPSLYVPSRGGHAANFVHLFSDTVLNEIPSMTYKIKRYV